MKNGPLDDVALGAYVVGSWLLDPREPCGRLPPGAFAATFTHGGDLVYSQRWSQGIARIFLTYRIEEGQLVTDQPSMPGEQRYPLTLDEAGRLHAYDLGERTIFVREEADEALDPDAGLLALAAVALRHGVAAASVAGPGAPFLMHEDGAGTRGLVRFVGEAPEHAHAAAARAAGALHDARACAFAVDGYLGGGSHGIHAIVVEASRRGRAGALLVAQPYTFDEHGRARASGEPTPPEETAHGLLS